MERVNKLWSPRCRCAVAYFMDDFGSIVCNSDAAKIRYVLKGW